MSLNILFDQFGPEKTRWGNFDQNYWLTPLQTIQFLQLANINVFVY